MTPPAPASVAWMEGEDAVQRGASVATVVPLLDEQSRAWLRALRADGPRRQEAVERLHALLLRAARFEVSRRRAALPQLAAGDLDELARDAASDALVRVLARLDEFQGRSRFTTWAYKFALLEAGVKVRRRTWNGREVMLDEERWRDHPSLAPPPDARAEQAALLGALRDALAHELTPRQRAVLVALALDGVPIDVLAERLGTTRGALYKTLHDARRKLRRALGAAGHLDSERGEVP
jgi:RNA polymerase sigma-70 factor (ECF subfamily)